MFQYFSYGMIVHDTGLGGTFSNEKINLLHAFRTISRRIRVWDFLRSSIYQSSVPDISKETPCLFNTLSAVLCPGTFARYFAKALLFDTLLRHFCQGG